METAGLAACAAMRTAIVLGATGGFGQACVRILANDGWAVIASARGTAGLDALKRSSPDVQTLALDLRSPDAMARLSAIAPQADLIVHAAAATRYAPFCDLGGTLVEEDLALNVRALVALLERYLPVMKARGSGAILTMSSTAALRPAPGIALYSAAKNFTLSLTECLAAELKQDGITLTCCVAGPMDTDFAIRSGYPRSGTGVSPDLVARRAIEASLSGKAVVYSDRSAMLRAFLYRILPGWLLGQLWRSSTRRA